MSKRNHTPEGLFRKFLQGGSFYGLTLGAWYAIASTILRYGLSANAFLDVDFLTLLVVAVVVGFILGGAWEVFLEVALPRYGHDGPEREMPVTRFILVEGGVRYGLTVGFFVAFATTFGKHGISSNPFQWLEFLFALGICLTVFFLAGCVFGFLMFGTVKRFRPRRLDGSRD